VHTLVHVTIGHLRFDTRIFVKECSTLATEPDFDVHLVVADGEGGQRNSNVTIHDAGRLPGGRLRGAVVGNWRVWTSARNLRPDVVHFHDPELVLLGLALRLAGNRVIYDVHEDYPNQVAYRHWIPRPLRRPVAVALSFAERLGGALFDGVVAVTPRIARRFPAGKTWVVNNFPIRKELRIEGRCAETEGTPTFAYVGGLFPVRGTREMVEAIGLLVQRRPALLELGGVFVPDGFRDELESLQGWGAVRYLGFLARPQVKAVLGRARAGLVVLHPVDNLKNAYPVKMFEYMAAGLPVIASDFPVWRDLLANADCALFVDPLDPRQIAEAMLWILEHPKEAEEMGSRGQEAVEHRFNWSREAVKLGEAYRSVLAVEGQG